MRLDWSSIEVKFVVGGYSQWPEGVDHSWTWSDRVIPDNDLWIFYTGQCEMQMRNGPQKLKADSIIWMRPGHFYNVVQDRKNPIGHTYIHFELIKPDGTLYYPPTDVIPEVFNCFNASQMHFLAQNLINIVNIGSTVNRRIRKLPDHYTPEDNLKTASVYLKSLLMMIDFYDTINAAQGGSSNRHNNAVAIKAALDMDASNDSFQEISKLARKYSLSRTRFSQIFTDYWAISPQEYQLSARIGKAKSRLMQYPDKTIAQIAEDLGYSDHFFFVRQFKQRTGKTPGQFRRENGGLNFKD